MDMGGGTKVRLRGEVARAGVIGGIGMLSLPQRHLRLPRKFIFSKVVEKVYLESPTPLHSGMCPASHWNPAYDLGCNP